MSRYQFTPQATDDLLDIWSFIARHSPDAADRVEEAVFRACDLLADSPLAGRKRDDLTRLPIRFWVVHPYSNYLIVYDPETKPLQIVRILHGGARSPFNSAVTSLRTATYPTGVYWVVLSLD